MEGGLIHIEGDNLQRCLRQISKSYKNSQLHPNMNGKLVKMFKEKENRLGGERGEWRKRQDGRDGKNPNKNRKQE